jgi:hypothetical protein
MLAADRHLDGAAEGNINVIETSSRSHMLCGVFVRVAPQPVFGWIETSWNPLKLL